MNVMTITAHYRIPADEAFTLACDLDAFRRDMGGLVDVPEMPRGKIFAGQSYTQSAVIWTFLRTAPVLVTCTRVDAVARIIESTLEEVHSARITRFTTHITPDGPGCIWTDTFETTGPPITRLSDAISRYLNKAAHRRRRARRITVRIERD